MIKRHKGRVNPRGWRPTVTIALILINVAVYLVEMVWARASQGLIYAPTLGLKEPYRFVSAAFAHAGFWHLAFNMYALWLVGTWLERAIGRWRFVCIYLLSAIGGNVAVLLTATQNTTSWYTGVVGASGAVFGLFGALFVAQRHIGRQDVQLLVIIGINLVIGFLPGLNISWQSHIGGLIMGAALMAATLHPVRRGRRASIARDIVVYLVGLGLQIVLIWYGYS